MPVSRPLPPYLQSPWHPPPTSPHTVTTLVPHSSYHDTIHTYTLQVPVQRLVDVQAERVMRVRRPVKVMVEEEVEEEIDDEPPALTQSALKDSKSEEWKEQTAADVVLDIAETQEEEGEDDPPPLSSSSLSSLTQPLTFAIPASSSSSSTQPLPSSYRLRAYNPRVVHGYLERQRPGARKLTTVPADSLPPPPFRPPSYPLSNIPPPVSPAVVFPALPSASAASSPPSLTITIPSSSPPLPALPDPDTADPTNLLSAGLVLRDLVELPRGSPRHLFQGVHIYAVLPNSRAAAAGLQAGDEVISVHGQSVRSAEEMTVRVNRIPGQLQTVIRRDSGDLQSVWL